MMRLPVIVAAAVIAWSTSASANYSIDFDHEAGMYPGRGYDSISGLVKGDCVVRSEPKTAMGSDTASTVFSLSRVENYSSIARLTGLRASASYVGNVGYIGGKAAFVQSVHVNDYSLYVLAQVRVINSTLNLVDSALTPSAVDVLNYRGPTEFRKLCGDAYISAITTGGELYAIIEITSHSEQQKRNIAASVSGSFGVFSGSGSFKSAIEKISKTSNINIYMYRAGGKGALKVTPDELITYAIGFPDEVRGANAFIFRATVAPYTNLLLPPGKSTIDVLNKVDVIDKMTEYKLQSIQTLTNIDYILSNPDEFIDENAEALFQAGNAIRENLNKVVMVARACTQNVDSCLYPTDLNPVKVAWPKRVEAPGLSAGDLQEKLRKQEEARARAEKEKEEALARARADALALEREMQAAEQVKQEAERLRTEALRKKEEAEAMRKKAEAEAREAQLQLEKSLQEARAAEQSAADARKRAEDARRKQDIVTGVLFGPGATVLKKVLKF